MSNKAGKGNKPQTTAAKNGHKIRSYRIVWFIITILFGFITLAITCYVGYSESEMYQKYNTDINRIDSIKIDFGEKYVDYLFEKDGIKNEQTTRQELSVDVKDNSDSAHKNYEFFNKLIEATVTETQESRNEYLDAFKEISKAERPGFMFIHVFYILVIGLLLFLTLFFATQYKTALKLEMKEKSKEESKKIIKVLTDVDIDKGEINNPDKKLCVQSQTPISEDLRKILKKLEEADLLNEKALKVVESILQNNSEYRCSEMYRDIIKQHYAILAKDSSKLL